MVHPGGTLLSEKAVTIDVNQFSLEFHDGELERDYQDSKQRVLFTFQGFQVCFAFCYLWSFSEVIYSTFWLGRVRFLYVWVTVLCFIAAHILPTQLKKIQASTMAKFRALNVFYLFFIVGCMGTLRLGTDYFQNDLGFGLVVGGFIGNCTFMGHLFSIDFRLFSACISLLCVASMILFYQRNDQSGEYLPEESRICFAYTYFLILSSRIVILQGRMNFGLMKRQAKENVRQKLSFISQLAHDIGTPLTAMSLATDCLKAARGEAERRDLMDSLDAGVQMLTVIRNEALSLAKVQAGADPEPSPGPVEVRPLLRQCAKIIEAYPGAPGLAFRFLVDPVRVPPALWTDLEWLSTMLINYLSNAKKYCPDGGGVRVALFVGRGPRGALPTARRNQQFLRVEVEDSGPGVPLAQRDLLFQPFSQLKDTRNGTGLGLFGVLTKAEKLGGTAGMHSNPFSEQGGSVFHFTFPLQDSQDKIAKDIDSTGPHLPLHGVVLFVLGEWETEDQNTLRDGNICYSKVEFCGGKLSVPPETYAGQQCVLLWRTDAVALLDQPKDMLKQTFSETFAAQLNVIGLVLVQQCTTRNTADQSEGVCAMPTHSQMIRARKQCGLQQKCFPFPLYLLKRDWEIMDVLAAVDSRSFQGQLVPLRHRSSSDFCNSPVQPNPPGGYRDTLAGERESTESTILLVDDSFTVIQLMHKLLTKKGIRIQHATNGQDGLQLMKQAAPLGIVCGLVDMSMPVLDGIGCLSQYRAWEKAEIENGHLQRPPMVLIAFTAQMAEYSITKILEAGADGVLAKPFHFHSLAGLIKQFHSAGRSLILNPNTFFNHQPDELSASLSREVLFPEYSLNGTLTQQQRLPLVRPKMRVKVLTGSGKRFSLKNNAIAAVNTTSSLFAETNTCSFADTNVCTKQSNKNKERIAVVIDDSPTVCKMVSRALTQEGYHVKVADDGIPGLQLLKRVCAEPNPSTIRCDVQRESEGAPQCSGEEFVFCLCDLQMPKMGGLEVIQHFRAWEREQGHKKEALIFAFSANADEIVRQQVMQAGATAIISKPFKLQTLKDLLTKHHHTNFP